MPNNKQTKLAIRTAIQFLTSAFLHEYSSAQVETKSAECFEATSIPRGEALSLFQSPFDMRCNSHENTVPGSTTSPSMRSPSSDTTKVMFSGWPAWPFSVVW